MQVSNLTPELGLPLLDRRQLRVLTPVLLGKRRDATVRLLMKLPKATDAVAQRSVVFAVPTAQRSWELEPGHPFVECNSTVAVVVAVLKPIPVEEANEAREPFTVPSKHSPEVGRLRAGHPHGLPASDLRLPGGRFWTGTGAKLASARG